MIYDYALGGDEVKLTDTNALKEMGYHACQWSQPYSNHYHADGEPCPRNRLSLLQTCRQIYVEAAPVLYSTNTFVILGQNNTPGFCDFSRSIRKDRLDLITSMYINCQAMYLEDVFIQDWRQMWEILATKMPGLKVLKVRLIKNFTPPLELALEKDWVRPMLKVRGLKRFDFDLAQEVWSEESTAEYNDKLEWFQNELQAMMCVSR